MAEEKEMVNPLIKPVGKLKTPTATRQIVGEGGTAEGLKATVMSVVPTDNLSYPSVAVKNGGGFLEGKRKEDDLEENRMEVDLEVNKENEEDLEVNKENEEDLEVNKMEEDLEVNKMEEDLEGIQKMNDLEEKIHDVNLEDGRYMSSGEFQKKSKMMNRFLLNKTHWIEKYIENLKKEREISYVPQPQMTSSPTSSHILEVKKGEYVKVLMGKTPVVFNRTPVVCYRLNDDLARKIMASPGQCVDTRFKEEYNKLNMKYIGRPVVEEEMPKPVPQPEKKKPLEVTKVKMVKARKEKSPEVQPKTPKPGLSLKEFVVSDNSDPEDDFDEDEEVVKKTRKKSGGKSKKSAGEPQQPKKKAPRHSKQVAKLVGEIAKSGNPLAKRPPGIGRLDPEVAARAVEKVKQAKAERELKDKMALEERRKKKEEDKQKKEDKKKTILLTDLVSPKALKAEQRKLKKAEKEKEEGTTKPKRVTKPRQPKKKEEVPLSMPVLVDVPPPKPKEASAVSEVPPQRFAKRTNFKKPSLSDISSSSLSFSSSFSSESSDEDVQTPAPASNPNVTTTAPSQKSPETLTTRIPDPVPEEIRNGPVEKPKSPSPPPVNSAVEENPQDAVENGQDEEDDLLEIFADVDDDLMPTDIEPSTSSGVRYRKLYD